MLLKNILKITIIILVGLILVNPASSDYGSGGTITHDGIYTIHTFTSNGTFIFDTSKNVSVLVVGGGGSGGGGIYGNPGVANTGGGGGGGGIHPTGGGGGGGGAGAFIYILNFSITPNTYNIVIGQGGAKNNNSTGLAGQNSSFSTLLAVGGGGGGASSSNGLIGGSGGGGDAGKTGGASTNVTFGGNGTNGGNGGTYGAPNYPGGGGGGAGSIGNAGSGTITPGVGGAGLFTSINGTLAYYSGGGGGGSFTGASGAIGGIGGGGAGGGASGGSGTNNGGSGIVIIRYLTSSPFAICNPTIISTTTNSVTINCISVNQSGSAWIQYGGFTNAYKFRTDYQTITGDFSKTITGMPLQAGATYYYKVMILNNGITYSSNESSFTLPFVTPITDYHFDTHTEDLAYSDLNITTMAIIIPEAYTDIVGNIFWGIVFSFIFLMFWLRQEDISIPAILGLLIGGSIWGLMPPEWVGFAYSLVIVSFAGLMYSLLKSKS